VGIDVGTGGIKIALVRDGVPIHLSQVTFGDGVVRNGEIADPRLMQKILKALWSRERLPAKKVRLGLAHPASFLRPMTTPDPGNPEDLRRAIELNAGAVLVGFDPTQTAFGYHVLGKHDSSLDVAIASLPTSVVREWSRVIERAGLDLVGLELSVAATGRALLDAGTVRLIVDIGSDYSTLALVEPGNSVRYLIVVEGGGSMFTQALLPLTGGDIHRAEQLKRACGIGGEPVGMVDLNTFREASAAMAAPRDLLVSRLSEALAVMERQGAQHPTQIILTGGGARLSGLHEALARYLTSSASPPVLTPALAAAPDADLYATALALSASAGASLLPPRRRRGRPKSTIGRTRVRTEDGQDEGAASAEKPRSRRKAELSPREGRGARSVSPPVMGLLGLAVGVVAVWGATNFYLKPSADDISERAKALTGTSDVERASLDRAVRSRITEATRIVSRRVDMARPITRWPELGRSGARVVRMRWDDGGQRFIAELRAPNAAAAVRARARIESLVKGANVLPGPGPVIFVELPRGPRGGADG